MLTKLQRRMQLVNKLWHYKLVDFWISTFEPEAYDLYDPNFVYVPSGKGKLTNPLSLPCSEKDSDDVKNRFLLYKGDDRGHYI